MKMVVLRIVVSKGDMHSWQPIAGSERNVNGQVRIVLMTKSVKVMGIIKKAKSKLIESLVWAP